MMLFQASGPAETGQYLVMGMVVTLGFIGGYIASLYWRFRNLRQENALIDELEQDE